MIRLPAIPAPLETTEADLPRLAAGALRINEGRIAGCRLVRRAIDARRKQDIHLALTLDVTVHGDEASVLRRCGHPGAAQAKPATPAVIMRLARAPSLRPVVVGMGPAGLFAALTLAQAGARPRLLERGRPADVRRRDVEAFWADGTLQPASNVQFGEGGAGTFSDGKLTTGIKSPDCARVLETFVRCGAPEEILWQAMPHIGTDRLIGVVQAMRREIEALGGTVHFETKLDGLRTERGVLRGVSAGGETYDADTLLLCIGHSARDTCQMLLSSGLSMEAKPFSIGARIEHPQALIDRAQYGGRAGHPALGAAPYKLAVHLPDGRGVYTFCMCPGGAVVAAASEAGGVVTNGMSTFARDGVNANSALLVEVKPGDLPADDPLAGQRFQRHWEALAFAAGGRGYRAPAQRVEDFLAGKASRAMGEVLPSYRPGVVPADLRACLPVFVTEAMAQAFPRLDGMLHGFALPDAALTGVETRSSSPVRILRDAQGQAGIRGVYPVGEGAGYAGGILSAAVDGIRAARQAIDQYERMEGSQA